MADKQSYSQIGADQTPGFVTTTGTVTQGTVQIRFDEADDCATVMDLIERAKLQIMKYYTTR